MSGRHIRNFIRVLVGAALCVALAAAVVLPIPEPLPAVAIRQASLYRLEVALLAFYGWLLLATPAFAGIVRGRLPVEISTRGARFAEEADQATKLQAQKIEALEQLTADLAGKLRIADVEIGGLKQERDNSKPALGSKDD